MSGEMEGEGDREGCMEEEEGVKSGREGGGR